MTVRPIEDWRPLAETRLPELAYRYIASAAGRGLTAEWNERRFDALRLAPRVGVDVSSIDTGIDLLGRRLAHPVLLAPTGCHRLFEASGELSSIRGAGTAGALYVVSSFTTSTLADIAAAARGPWWFQLNVPPNRDFVAAVIAEAVARGAEAIVLTLDTPVAGMRTQQGWDGVSLPDGIEFGVLRDLPGGLVPPPGEAGIYRPSLDPALTWQRVAELVADAPVPVLVKGVLRGDDAKRAADAGVAGIVVSNHGGRNLDGLPATIDALPGVVGAVGDRLPVLVDGGIRTGTDVLKALALGARAVLVGRPYLWALAAAGADGVRDVVVRLKTELEMTMALCGLRSVDEISPDVLWR